MKRKWQRNWKHKLMKKLAPPVLAGMMLLSSYNTVLANPSGGVVTAGAATISTSGATLTVKQATNKAAINWQSFGIGSGETVRFIQPSASSVALNRVVGGNASAIYGTLSANGKVFLVNPNGILFAPGSQVNVGGLVASTLNLSDSDFLKGNYSFAKNAVAGSVVNQGTIRTADGGYVAFLGPQVRNEGLVAAQTVGLVAGDKVSLDFDGDKLLSFRVDTLAAGASATNSGNLLADGGTVVMSTGTKGALLNTVVNNTGVIQARTVKNGASGKIILEGGTVNVGGTLDAGAPNGGNGGFIETSGAYINMAPGLVVTTLAPQGKTGTWLVDPEDYTIGTGPTATNYWNNEGLSTALNSNNIIVQTVNDSGVGNGDIHVNAPVSWSSHKLTLSAYRNINIKSTLTATGTSSLAMTSGAGGSIDYGLTASGFTGKVNFSGRTVNAGLGITANTGFLTINGNDYTVITSLGNVGSTSKTDLQGINGDLSGNYFLGADINASDTSGWNGGAGFMPIGNYGENFTGVFDGGGHTISGLTINRPTTNRVGLFGMTSGGKLGNLSLVNASISGNKFAGSLAGEVINTQITKISATALVTIVNVEGTSAAGGLVGSNSGTISNSYAAGSVTGNYTSVNAGGLAGSNSGSISNSYATGSVTGIGNVGGLVGINNRGSISDSYATGSVTGHPSDNFYAAGGLVGKNGGDEDNRGTISNSYATGMVSGSRVGGLVGAKLQYGFVTNSYWDKDTSGQAISSTGGSGRTTTELMSGLPTGFSIDVWGIIPGTSYPYLKWSHPTPPQVVSGFVKDAGGTALAGQTVQTLANGNLVGSTGSGANGFYYLLMDNNSIANNAAVLSYVSALGSAAKYVTATNQSLTGLNITSGQVAASSGGGLDVTALLAASKGSNTDNTLYTKDGSLLTVNSDLYVTADGDVSQSGSLALTVNGATTVNAGTNNITLNSTVNDFTGAVTLTGNNVTLQDKNSLVLGTVNAPGSFTLTAGGTITANSAVTTGVFDLKGGGWSQVKSSLPTFSATDFRISGGMFRRALGGAGISGAPYQISDIYGLQGVGSTEMLTKSFILANDIVATATSAWNSNAGFKPIGVDGASAFSGNFDGGGHSISGLTINQAGAYTGLFGYTNGATIANLGMTGGSVTGTGTVGGLVGYMNEGSITNSYNTGNVTNSNASSDVYVGGLVGHMNKGSITSSYNAGNVSVTNTNGTANTYGGGLVGYNEGGNNSSISRITNSYNTGSVTISSANPTINVGGLAGYMWDYTSISNSYNTGSVTATSENGNASTFVGGLMGYMYNGNANITNSYNTGSINADGTSQATYVGGLAGINRFHTNGIKDSYNTGSVTAAVTSGTAYVGGLAGLNTGNITNSYTTGHVDASGASATSYIGGLVGGNADPSYSGTGTFGNSYWDTILSGISDLSKGVGNVPNAAGVSGLATAQMKQAGNYSTWDTELANPTTSVWYLNGSQTAPLLRAFLTPLTVSADSATKVYDRTAAAGPANATYTPGSGTYDAAKVAGSGLNWTGNIDAGEYSLTGDLYTTSQQGYLISYDPTSKLTITPKTLTAGLTGTVEKVYDGTTTATLTSGNYNIGGIVGGDAVYINTVGSSGSYSDKNVNLNGDKAVTVSGITLTGDAAGNYTLASDTLSGNVGKITPATLTASLTGTVEKVYDGTTTAMLTGANYNPLSGIFSGDEVTFNIATSGGYADKNAGEGKQVSVSGLGLSGGDAGNYQLASTTISGNVGKITPASLTLTAATNSKVYDGTIIAAATPTVSGTVYDASSLGATYDNKNVGNGKTLTPVITFANPSDAANYSITLVTADTGTITPAPLTITANNVSRQIGVENPAFSVTYAGLASGDSASSLSGLLSYTTPATKDSPAGTYTITPSGLTSDNYTISWVDGVLTVNRQTDAYISALAMVTGLAATPPMPMLAATGVTRIGVSGGTPDSPDTPAGATGTPSSTNPSGSSPVITQVPGLPLTLTGSGINTGGQPVIFAAEQE